MKTVKGMRIGTVIFLVAATAVVSAIGTYFYISTIYNNINQNQQMFKSLSNVEQIVTQNYVLNIDPQTGYSNIQDGIIEGYINGLGDKNSYFINEKNYKLTNISSGNVGIGIVTAYDKETECIKVLIVKNGSPAKAAGLKPGDIVLTVDGKNVTEDGYRNSVQAISGEENSIVTLTAYREGEENILTFDIQRSNFDEKTVIYRMLENNIGFIRINEFDLTTLTDLTAAINDFSLNGARAIIIDVRFNAYGDYQAAIDCLDYLMPSATICSRKEKDSAMDVVYTSDPNGVDLPMIAIQNEETRGAAEVFTAALRDNNIATITGEPSAGSGVTQRMIPLSDNTAINLSVYEYITPDGEKIEGNGIIPNFEVSLSDAKKAVFETLADADDDQLLDAISRVNEILGIS